MTPEMSAIPKRLGTKEYIVHIFHELLKRESFDALSVQSIVTACGISRTTFYRLFQDKDDLLIWSFVQQVDEIAGHAASGKEYLSRILELIYSNKQYFRKILKSDRGRQILGDYVFQYTVHTLHARMMQEADHRYPPDVLLTKIEFCYMGARYVTRKWLSGDTGEPPDVIADLILDCFPEPIRSYCLMETTPGNFSNSHGER